MAGANYIPAGREGKGEIMSSGSGNLLVVHRELPDRAGGPPADPDTENPGDNWKAARLSFSMGRPDLSCHRAEE